MKLSWTAHSRILRDNPAPLIAGSSLVVALAIAGAIQLVQGESIGTAVTSTVEHFGKSAELQGQLFEDLRRGLTQQVSER
jgi:hypothetical protein